MARMIGVVTTARSDFGCLLPLLKGLYAHQDVTLQIYASGTHFSPVNDFSISEVEREFADCTIRIPCTFDGDGPAAIAKVMGQILLGLTNEFEHAAPEMLVVSGDRYDMIPAVLAATPFNIPIIHLSGGEVTEGVFDDAIRHAVTKLSHIHFATNEVYARRLVQLGEEAWRVHVSGEPGLDSVRTFERLSKAEAYAEFGFDPDLKLSLFTYHPETINPAQRTRQLSEVFAAMRKMTQETQLLLTHPNSDPGSVEILSQISEFSKQYPNCRVIPSLGKTRYFQLLACCDCLVGNSSSGLVEAASFALPALNIGDRQSGRLEPRNVISVPARENEILAGWRRTLSAQFRESTKGMTNPYGDGSATRKIVDTLLAIDFSGNIVRKKFVDIDWSANETSNAEA